MFGSSKRNLASGVYQPAAGIFNYFVQLSRLTLTTQGDLISSVYMGRFGFGMLGTLVEMWNVFLSAQAKRSFQREPSPRADTTFDCVDAL